MLIRYFAQYGEEPDSAYGEEVYVHAPTLESAGECILKSNSTYRGSYTTSLASNVTDYKVENNRRYHAYKEGSMWPN